MNKTVDQLEWVCTSSQVTSREIYRLEHKGNTLLRMLVNSRGVMSIDVVEPLNKHAQQSLANKLIQLNSDSEWL